MKVFRKHAIAAGFAAFLGLLLTPLHAEPARESIVSAPNIFTAKWAFDVKPFYCVGKLCGNPKLAKGVVMSIQQVEALKKARMADLPIKDERLSPQSLEADEAFDVKTMYCVGKLCGGPQLAIGVVMSIQQVEALQKVPMADLPGH